MAEVSVARLAFPSGATTGVLITPQMLGRDGPVMLKWAMCNGLPGSTQCLFDFRDETGTGSSGIKFSMATSGQTSFASLGDINILFNTGVHITSSLTGTVSGVIVSVSIGYK